MGYTQYWRQLRVIDDAEWRAMIGDGRIASTARYHYAIDIADGSGKAGTEPALSDTLISLNGRGNEGSETFMIGRPRDDQKFEEAFCKTERRPYDTVVTAILCSRCTATLRIDPVSGTSIAGSEAFEVASDGREPDFRLSLEIARRTLPMLAELDTPCAVAAANVCRAAVATTRTVFRDG